MLGSLGFQEIVFILLLALLIFGPKRLPELAKGLGRAMGEVRKASNDFRRTFNAEISVDEDEREPKSRRLTDLSAEDGGAPRPTIDPALDSETASPTEPTAAPRPVGAVARGDIDGIPDEIRSSDVQAGPSATTEEA